MFYQFNFFNIQIFKLNNYLFNFISYLMENELKKLNTFIKSRKSKSSNKFNSQKKLFEQDLKQKLRESYSLSHPKTNKTHKNKFFTDEEFNNVVHINDNKHLKNNKEEIIKTKDNLKSDAENSYINNKNTQNDNEIKVIKSTKKLFLIYS